MVRLIGFLLCLAVPAVAEISINQLQFVGSHNSYKKEMSWGYAALLRLIDADAALALEYAHPPLTRQLDLGLRKLELDVFYDPLEKAFDVGHVQVIDMNSQCATLSDCLTEIRAWSNAHSEHVPVWISFNAKDQIIPWLPDPSPFTPEAFEQLDQLLERALGDRLIRPREVVAPAACHPLQNCRPVWPSLTEAAGKFLLILDEAGEKRALYAQGWRQRPMFLTVEKGHPAAALMIINDPVASQVQIRNLVKQGFMVRTRADANTVEARENSGLRRDAAFTSGAQAISTDYLLPNNRFGTEYRVIIEDGVRCNPVSAAGLCQASDLK